MSGFYITNSKLLQGKAEFLKPRGNKIDTKICLSVSIVGSSYKSSSITQSENGDMYIAADNQLYNTDSLEVLYRRYGTECLKYLNGGFSFVIYDSAKNILFGARDRLGEKPFFYYYDGKNIECSSSLKAICYGKSSLEINETAKKMYIKYGFLYDTACIFKEVKKLPAGHYFMYDLTTNKMSIHKYWDLDPKYFENYPSIRNTAEAVEYIDNLLYDSIRIRVPSHEKIGMGISSGTDSFTIYNYLRSMEKDPPLFSVVSWDRNSPYNEYPYAVENVRSVFPDKSIDAFFLDDNEYIDGVNDYFEYYEEPNSDFSCPITNLLFNKMKNCYNTDIAFSGIGADDIFFGKPVYTNFFGNIKAYNVSYTPGLEAMCDQRIEIDDFSEVLDPSNVLSMQNYDIKTYLPNLLVKEDIASTHYGIEVRSPFCDHRLVEFLSTLSREVIFPDGRVKYLMKLLIQKKFKIDFFNRRKIGFFPNLKNIASIKSIREDLFETLNADRIKTYFPEMSIDKIKYKMDNYLINDSERNLLNLYFYIKMMLNYREKIFC